MGAVSVLWKVYMLTGGTGMALKAEKLLYRPADKNEYME